MHHRSADEHSAGDRTKVFSNSTVSYMVQSVNSFILICAQKKYVLMVCSVNNSYGT